MLPNMARPVRCTRYAEFSILYICVADPYSTEAGVRNEGVLMSKSAAKLHHSPSQLEIVIASPSANNVVHVIGFDFLTWFLTTWPPKYPHNLHDSQLS